MTLDEMIHAVQTKVGVESDGKPGIETWTAIYTAVMGVPPNPTPALADPNSEAKIALLLPEVRPYARALIEKAGLVGIEIRVISSLRTFAEQDALYAQGRTKPGPIVTNARGGRSNHNFGIAFDVGVFEGGRYKGNSVKYKAVGAIGMDLGLDWGGNWKSIKDEPHFQLRPSWAANLTEGAMLTELNRRHAAGQAIYT